MQFRNGAVRGVVPAMVTPYRDDGSVDSEAYLDLLEKLARSGVHGLMIMGTTGEGPLLSVEERREILDFTAHRAAQVPLIPNVGHPATRHAVALGVYAAEHGFTSMSAVAPFYYPSSPQELVRHYRTLARAVAPAGLYLYTIPIHTHNPIPGRVLRELLDSEPNVLGIKDSTGDVRQLSEYVSVCRERGAVVLGGNDRLFLHGLGIGAQGAVTSAAGVFPEAYLAVWNAYQNADLAAAHEAQRTVDALCTVFRDGTHLGLYKTALGFRGVRIGPARPPFPPVTEEDQRQLTEGLLRVGVIKEAKPSPL